MMHALIDNGAVVTFPYSLAQMKRDNPRVSFPPVLTFPVTVGNGEVHAVTRADRPSIEGHQVAVLDAEPTLDGSAWVVGWTVRDKTAGELATERADLTVTKIALKRACQQQTDWKGSGDDLWTIATGVIATLTADQQENWQLATVIERENSDFVAMAQSPAIGATPAEIDAVFRLAKTLE